MTATLTPAEQQEAERLLAGLHDRGYIDYEQHKTLTAGARVRHRGQQYPEAYRDGTGNIVAVTARNERDVELVVAYDKPRFEGMSRLTVLADYHVEVIG
ncbi:hypothetical protein [Paractinoplanes toevensis]|uniref:Uncharacterized protein n=1 Tax=Paractinoplanes toevensis TaxID=571911 RepID=A0A919T6X2_9ACTN|nr:hypothetical protein [Actinoplanes toevensis]GIM88859.1 hypothetical protein Ato02nite_006520 [Actinoplanes toevensis]